MMKWCTKCSSFCCTCDDLPMGEYFNCSRCGGRGYITEWTHDWVPRLVRFYAWEPSFMPIKRMTTVTCSSCGGRGTRSIWIV